MFYLSSKESRRRQKEAQNARNNRAEIVKAHSIGQITRRDLYKWGLLTAGGLALKNGLSPFARSAYASVPTGTPSSPLFGVKKYTQPFRRLALQTPVTMSKIATSDPTGISSGDAAFPAFLNERPARRLSYHDDFTKYPSTAPRNPLTGRGPIEGRPPGEIFAHQRWNEFFPKKGYIMSLAPVAPNSWFHPNLPAQAPNSVWTYGSGNTANGKLPPFLIQLNYGETATLRA